MLMQVAALLTLMLAVITFFAEFGAAAFEALLAIIVLGASLDLYVYTNVPAVSSWVPLVDMSGALALAGLAVAARSDIKAKEAKSQ